MSLSQAGTQVRRDSKVLLPGQYLGNLLLKAEKSVVSLCHTQNPRGTPSSPEKLASAPGGLCTTGLQDRDVSTMAAIISSISTASDFLDSSRWKSRLFPETAGHVIVLYTSGLSFPHPHSNQPVCTLNKAWRSLLILREIYSFWIIIPANPSITRVVPLPLLTPEARPFSPLNAVPT